jgi:uncharacterized protein YdeI (YjbR/CyaY-like superfamily)
MSKDGNKRLNPNIDDYLRDNKQWRKELQALRTIVLDCGLTEEWKWRAPCYTHQGANVVLIGALREGCALSFMKGALLKDAEGILVKPGENTRAARLIRFTNVQEIIERQSILTFYIHEAIELENAGVKVDFEKDRKLDLPPELQDKFDESPTLQTAFEALTPGRKRGYLLYFSGAKRATARASRIEKHVERILNGKGIHDCVCGQSRKMPNCDGSHKVA